MIVVTRLNGAPLGLNPDLLQRAECSPDTVLTLVDGSKYVVEESLDEIIRLVNDHKSHILARAQRLAFDELHADGFAVEPPLQLVGPGYEPGGPDDDTTPDDPPPAPPVLLRPRSH